MFDKYDTKLKPLDYKFACFIRNLASLFFFLFYFTSRNSRCKNLQVTYDDEKIQITNV